MSASDLPRLKGGTLALAATVLALANFMVVLDTTITNVAMPTIAGNLGVSTDEGTWIITAYAVAEAITIPLTGWLVRQFGDVKLFLLSVVGFIAASIACGLSYSLPMLVFFRVLQGLAGGPLIPLSSTLLISVFPREKSNIAISLWGMMTVVAPILGPIFGGLISDNWSWQWVFYINLGFGAFVGLAAWRTLQGRNSPVERSRFDVVGLLLLVAFISTFQVFLDKGRELDWFGSRLIVVCAIVSLISLVFLIIWELTEPDPVIDLSLFKSRNWLVSTVVLCVMFGLFFGNIVLTPLWLQKQMQYTATWAGYATAPMGVLAVITSPIVGRLLPKVDPRRLVSFGMGVLALSFFMRAHETTQADFGSVAWPMFVLGAGIPACIITLTSLGVSDLPDQQIAAGAGLQNFLRVMSMAIGATLTQTYVEHMGKFSRNELVNAISPDAIHTIASKAGGAGIGPEGATAYFSKLVDGQANMLATNDYYAIATLLMLGAIGLIWFAKRPEGPLKKVTH